MGLFSKVTGGSKPFPNSEPEAVLGLIFAVIAADGDISEDEKDSFIYLANKTTSLGPMPADAFWNHVETCKGILRREGPGPLMERCAPLISADKRKAAFLNCCDLIMRDGRVEPEEEEMIEALQARLSLSDDFARDAVEMTLTKYSL